MKHLTVASSLPVAFYLCRATKSQQLLNLSHCHASTARTVFALNLPLSVQSGSDLSFFLCG